MSKPSIYVAGAWYNRHELKKLMDRLASEHGFRITSTWPGRETGINTPDKLALDAKMDLEEVANADMVLAVMEDPKYAYRGTFTEIGYALGQNKRVFIVCPGTVKQLSDTKCEFSFDCMTNVFYWHPNVIHCATLEEAVSKLVV